MSEKANAIDTMIERVKRHIEKCAECLTGPYCGVVCGYIILAAAHPVQSERVRFIEELRRFADQQSRARRNTEQESAP